MKKSLLLVISSFLIGISSLSGQTPDQRRNPDPWKTPPDSIHRDTSGHPQRKLDRSTQPRRDTATSPRRSEEMNKKGKSGPPGSRKDSLNRKPR